MATYPKQLQLFDRNVTGGYAGTVWFAGTGVIAGNTPAPITVNQVIHRLEEKYTGHAENVTHVRHAPRFRTFDTSFGDVVVFADPPGSTQVANQLIEKMRDLWDIDRAVSNNSIGYATSTQN
jgi:hypothetical protein